MTCISTPISWLRLEQFAARSGDAAVAAHVASCQACARCLDEIRTDVVALPVLAVPAKQRARMWYFVPALALAVAALVLVLRPTDPPHRADTVAVKGIGVVVIGTVRERDGVIRDDMTTFLPGDRWKIVVTCPPAATAWLDVDVGGDRPLPPARTTCGNRVVIPGAFSLTGSAPNRICVRIAADNAPGATAPAACVTVHPE